VYEASNAGTAERCSVSCPGDVNLRDERKEDSRPDEPFPITYAMPWCWDVLVKRSFVVCNSLGGDFARLVEKSTKADQPAALVRCLSPLSRRWFYFSSQREDQSRLSKGRISSFSLRAFRVRGKSSSRLTFGQYFPLSRRRLSVVTLCWCRTASIEPSLVSSLMRKSVAGIAS
jgi:hypothetical protein